MSHVMKTRIGVVVIGFLLLSRSGWSQTESDVDRVMTIVQDGLAVETSDPRAAIQKYLTALDECRPFPDRRYAAAVLYRLGVVHVAIGEYTKALAYYEQGLVIRSEAKDRQGEVSILSGMGEAYERLAQEMNAAGLHGQAIEALEKAVAIHRRSGLRRSEARALGLLGVLHRTLDDHAKAIGRFEEALPIARAEGARDMAGAILNNAAGSYQALSQYAKAIDYYMEALPIARELPDRRAEGAVLDNLGSIYEVLGDYPKAFALYVDALAVTRKANDAEGTSAVLNGLGNASNMIGNPRKAIEYAEEALRIARERADRIRQIDALNILGMAHRVLGEHTKAIEYYDQSRAIAREFGHRAGEASALHNLGVVYDALKEYDKAADFYERTLILTRTLGNRSGEAWTLSCMMESAALRGRPRIAVLYGKKAVNLYQEIRQGLAGLDRESRRNYVESKERAYRRLADLLLHQDRILEAQKVLDLLKEEEFFDFVRRDPTQMRADEERLDLTRTEAEWEQRYNEIAAPLTALGRERDELSTLAERTAEQEKRLAAIDQDLIVAGKAFQQFLARLNAEVIQNQLSQEKLDQIEDHEALMEPLRVIGDGAVAIYTLVTDDKLWLIVRTPTVAKSAQTPIQRIDLNAKILTFRQELQNRKSDPRALARELYDVLLEPIENDLEGAKAGTLLWSLDGALRYMPVAALHDGKRYLVERFRNVVFTPASTVNLKDVPAAQWRALGLGVSKAHGGIPALPGARKELEGIIRDETAGSAGVLPGTIRLDEAFTRDTMLAGLRQRYAVVHIASHFKFRTGNASDSYLLLGDGARMSLADLGALQNPFGGVDVVTLSACETAIGETGENGEEVEGFGVLAQRKGAKAVIATLWPVGDESTNELMRSFYRLRESKPGTTKAVALQQAQQSLLQSDERVDAGKDYRHPFYWAPFILIGNSR